MTTVVLFGSSSILAGLILILKWFELRSGKNGFLLLLLNKLNPHAESLIQKLRLGALQIVQTIRYIVLVRIPGALDNAVEKARMSAVRELESRKGMLLGRRDITSRGSVSFFLRKMNENKQNGERGEINDPL